MPTSNSRFSLNGKATPQANTSPDALKTRLTLEHAQRYTELNKLWEQAEKALSEIPHPNDVYVCYETIQPDPFDHGDFEQYSYIGFIKVEGGWKICIGWADNNPDPRNQGVGGWRPIAECSQDTRTETIAHISKLRDKMLQEAEANLPKLDKAIAEFQDVLAGW